MSTDNTQSNTTPDYRDALVYAAIQNEITENNFRTKPGSALFMNYDSNTTMYDTTTPSKKMFSNFLDRVGERDGNNLNNMLSQTTIKRACCMGNEDDTKKYFRITVKLPYVEDIAQKITPRPDTVTLENWRRLGYMHKEVLVPKEMCPADYKKSTNTDGIFTKCDKFYQLYCENSKLLYSLDVSGKYVEEDFRVASPDCGCYLDKPPSFPTGVQPACYTGFCYSVPVAYTDPATRQDGACTVNNCTSVFNIGDLQALTGGTIDAQFNLNQTCGATKQLMDQTKEGKMSKEELAKKLGVPYKPGSTPASGEETQSKNSDNASAGSGAGSSDAGAGAAAGAGAGALAGALTGAAAGAAAGAAVAAANKDEKKEEPKQEEKKGNNMMLIIIGAVVVIIIIIIIIVVIIATKKKGSAPITSSSSRRRGRSRK